MNKKRIKENEKKFGQELREKYDEKTIQSSYDKISKIDDQDIDGLTKQINETLSLAFKQGNPKSQLAQEVCELHKQWICMFWPEGMYSSKAHLQLVESYLEDERFIDYYDQLGKGCTKFLYEAMKIYCK